MLAMLVMIWTSSVFNFWASEQRAQFKYRTLVVITLITSIAKPLLGIFLVTHAEDRVSARILGLVLVELITYSGLFFVQMARGKQFFSRRFWKHALAFNIPLLPHYLSQTILNSADRLMIQNMVGDSEAGIYSLAYSISQIMTIFNTALLQTINPWIYIKIKERKVTDIARVAYIALLLIAIANIMLIAIAPEVVSIFAPSSYYAAISVIPPIAMSVFFQFSYSLFADFAFYYEKTKMIATATMLGAILNILLNYIFINRYGYYAAGYTTLVCYIVYAVFHYCCMRKICKQYMNNAKVYDFKYLILITCCFMVMGFLFLATYSKPIARYGLIIFIMILMMFKRKELVNGITKMIQIRK